MANVGISITGAKCSVSNINVAKDQEHYSVGGAQSFQPFV